MRVLMLGWEFPPHISGGLGTACYGMTKGLDEIGVEVCFVLPSPVPARVANHVSLRGPMPIVHTEIRTKEIVEEQVRVHVTQRRIEAPLRPYARPVEAGDNTVVDAIRQQTRSIIHRHEQVAGEMSAVSKAAALPSGQLLTGPGAQYEGDLIAQVRRYARMVVEVSQHEPFDVIHAHDWMTFPAGLAVSAISGKPLVVHVHSTEFDRSGDVVNQQIYDIERAGMLGATRVVCVSQFTRSIVLQRYGVPGQNVVVVHNAVEPSEGLDDSFKPIRRDEKIVLFMGRMTMQKGPEYFLLAAKKVIEKFQKVRFVMAGSGDMIAQCIRLAADLKLGRYVTFTGFLRGRDVDRIYEMADLYVMPSVSEPFGITPLEALAHDVPVIISKQSGVSEVLKHALKVDFWDVDDLADKILAVLRHPTLDKALRRHGHIDLGKLSWRDSAKKLKEIYDAAMGLSPQ